VDLRLFLDKFFVMKEEEVTFKERKFDNGELPTSTDEDDCVANSLFGFQGV